jgi:hypothetical protein
MIKSLENINKKTCQGKKKIATKRTMVEFERKKNLRKLKKKF